MENEARELGRELRQVRYLTRSDLPDALFVGDDLRLNLVSALRPGPRAGCQEYEDDQE